MTSAEHRSENVQPEYSEASQLHTLRSVLPYLWPADQPSVKIRVVIAIIMLIIAKVVTVATPFAFKLAVDALDKPGNDQAVTLVIVPLALVLAYIAGRILMVLFTQARDALFAKVGQSAVRQLAVKTFQHLHRLSLQFHLERRTGGLSRVIERGTKGIDIILRYALFNSIPTVLEVAFVCGTLWLYFDWRYAVATLASIVVYVLFTYYATEWRINIRRAMNDADTDANTKAIDSLLNFETVKYFGNEGHETARFEKSMDRYEKAATKTWTSLAVLNSGQTIIFCIGMAACMIMAAQDAARGAITTGDFVLVNAFLIQLYIPLNFIGMVYRDIKQGLVDIGVMIHILSIKPGVEDAANAPPLAIAKGEIEFDNVGFSYEDGRQIFNGLSFKIAAGKTIAIVGPSGAGKSTISRLLYRFYDLEKGAIRIDGQDIARVTQASLRQAIGMVPQDTVLFNDTIRYNIRYGKPSASDAEVEQVAQMAQIHSFIEELPGGYESMVGERGLKLSGGEKQRVSIARTLLKSPPILVLDEATSALDTLTEKEIQTSLKLVSQNRTTLIIAHRLSTIVEADEIIVLEKGRLVERGRHTQLLRKKGVYADLWNRQRAAEEARAKLAARLRDDDQLQTTAP